MGGGDSVPTTKLWLGLVVSGHWICRDRQGAGADPDVFAIRIGGGSLVVQLGALGDLRLGPLIHSRHLNGPWRSVQEIILLLGCAL